MQEQGYVSQPAFNIFLFSVYPKQSYSQGDLLLFDQLLTMLYESFRRWLDWVFADLFVGVCTSMCVCVHVCLIVEILEQQLVGSVSCLPVAGKELIVQQAVWLVHVQVEPVCWAAS